MENKETPEQDMLVVPVNAINEILEYLGTKPYKEVALLIANVHKEAKVLPKEGQEQSASEAVPPTPPAVPRTRAPRKKEFTPEAQVVE
jgi:hypothetical protein